jgi:hypothetical protein
MARLDRSSWGRLGVALVALLATTGAAWAQSPLLELKPSNVGGPNVAATPSLGFIRFFCYDAFTLLPINCTVTATLGPLDPIATDPPFFGGHFRHNTSQQPVGTIRDPNLGGAGAKSVTGQTGQTFFGFTAEYTAPEPSGEVQFLISWAPPSNYFCQDDIEGVAGQGGNPCFMIRHVNIGFELEPLAPQDDTFYKVVRGDTNRHPDGTSGTPRTLATLKLIAAYYSNFIPPLRLSVNDISLPEGGLFDIKQASEWNIPHQTHRKGTDVDLNQAPVDANGNPTTDIPCADDLALQISVMIVANGARRPRLVCEPDITGRLKHLSF